MMAYSSDPALRMNPAIYAIEQAHALQREDTSWARIKERLGQEGARQVFRLFRDNETVNLGSYEGDMRWAIDLVLRVAALASWASSGWPLVTVSYGAAQELASIDPPGEIEMSPLGGDEWTCLGMLIGREHFRLVTAWRTATSIGVVDPANPPTEPLPFQDDDLRRLVTNTAFALLSRPRGFRIRRLNDADPEVMEARGIRHYPGIAYILQLPHRPGPGGFLTNEILDDDEDYTPRQGTPLSLRVHVREHWRWQACGPGRTEIRLVRIPEHEKGPKGAPVSISPVIVDASHLRVVR